MAAPPSASAMLEALAQRKARLEDELRDVEKQVYHLETSYLNDSSTHGNVLKGFEGFLGPAKTQKCAARQKGGLLRSACERLTPRPAGVQDEPRAQLQDGGPPVLAVVRDVARGAWRAAQGSPVPPRRS